MAYTIEQGSNPLRKEVVDSMVKQIAAKAYKFKQAVSIVPTSAWKNSFFREDPTILTAKGTQTIKGIPRGANFPQSTPKWEEVSVKIIKHGLEDNIPWEDIISSDINVQARTIFKITEGVVKSVDDDIWSVLTEGGDNRGVGTNKISSFALSYGGYGPGSNGGAWNQTSSALVDDLNRASQIIGENNYDTGDLMVFVSPKDKRSIMKYLADKGAQFPTIATDVVSNGKVGVLAGMTIIESNSVTASMALIVKPKVCATYKELVGLRSTTVDDPFKSVLVRVVEEGVVELTDPKAIVAIYNTQTGSA